MARKLTVPLYDSSMTLVSGATMQALGPYPTTSPAIALTEIGSTGYYQSASTVVEGTYVIQRDPGTGFATVGYVIQAEAGIAAHLVGHGTGTGGAIATADIEKGAVTTEKIATGAIGEDHLDATLLASVAAATTGQPQRVRTQGYTVADFDGTYDTILIDDSATAELYVGRSDEDIASLIRIVDITTAGSWVDMVDDADDPLTVLGAYTVNEATAGSEAYGYAIKPYLKLSGTPKSGKTFIFLMGRKEEARHIGGNGKEEYNPQRPDLTGTLRPVFEMGPIDTTLAGKGRVRIYRRKYDADGHLYLNGNEVNASASGMLLNSHATNWESVVYALPSGTLKTNYLNIFYTEQAGNADTPEIELFDITFNRDAVNQEPTHVTSNSFTLGKNNFYSWDGTAAGTATLSNTLRTSHDQAYFVMNADSTYNLELTPDGGDMINGTTKLVLAPGELGICWWNGTEWKGKAY